MAGGRGSRLKATVEKPLLSIHGKPMIEKVIVALRGSKYVTKVFVATSKWTPKTKSVAEDLGATVIETSGLGYVNDLREALAEIWSKHNFRDVVVVNSDLPLLNSQVIDEAVEKYLASGKEALTIVVRRDDYEGLGFKSDHQFELNGVLVVPVGLNVLRADLIMRKELLDEVLCLCNKAELLVNVNTMDEAKRAEELLKALESV